MTEFHTEITERATRAVQSLRTAQESGDDYLAAVREAELENLARLAQHEPPSDRMVVAAAPTLHTALHEVVLRAAGRAGTDSTL